MKSGLLAISPPVLSEREKMDVYSEIKKNYNYNRALYERLDFVLAQNEKTIEELKNEVAELKKAKEG